MAPITIIPKACSCCKGERSSRDISSNLPLPNILYEGSEGGDIAFGDAFCSQRYGIYFMSPVLHDKEGKPSFPSKGRRRRRRIGESVA